MHNAKNMTLSTPDKFAINLQKLNQASFKTKKLFYNNKIH